MTNSFQLITPDQFQTTRWKNGGGVTHEIAKHEADGQLHWRLSMAEVDTDGPFSAFEGLMRVLTVIDGEGLDLKHPDGVMQALPMSPQRFSGDLPIDCKQLNGPVRDFNLIFDAKKVRAGVTVLRAGKDWQARADCRYGLFCVNGAVSLGGKSIPHGALALFNDAAGSLALEDGAQALLVSLGAVPTFR